MTTLRISISPKAEARLRKHAEAKGLSVDQYAADVLERTGSFEDFDDVLAPLRSQVQESGISDSELAAFVDELREEAYQERKQRPE